MHQMTPKWHWTQQGQMYLICVTSVLESQISILFTLWPAVFELQAILRRVHQMIPKWPWTIQGQMYPIYVLLVSPIPKFQSISLYSPTRSNVLNICITSIPRFQILLNFALWPADVDIQAILRQVHWITPKWPWTLHGTRYKVAENRKFRQCTELPQTDFEILTVKSTSYTLSTPEAQLLVGFALQPSVFRDTKLSTIGKLGNATIDLKVTLHTYTICLEWLFHSPGDVQSHFTMSGFTIRVQLYYWLKWDRKRCDFRLLLNEINFLIVWYFGVGHSKEKVLQAWTICCHRSQCLSLVSVAKVCPVIAVSLVMYTE